MRNRIRELEATSPYRVEEYSPQREVMEASVMAIGTYGRSFSENYLVAGASNGMLQRTSAMFYSSNDSAEYSSVDMLFRAWSTKDPYHNERKVYISHPEAEALLLQDQYNMTHGFGKELDPAIQSLGTISRQTEGGIERMAQHNVRNGLLQGVVYLNDTAGRPCCSATSGDVPSHPGRSNQQGVQYPHALQPASREQS